MDRNHGPMLAGGCAGRRVPHLPARLEALTFCAVVLVLPLAGTAAADCNGNGIPDAEELLAEDGPDCNLNGIPDECEIPFVAGVRGQELSTDGAARTLLLGDFNGDGREDLGVGTDSAFYMSLRDSEGGIAAEVNTSSSVEPMARRWATGDLDGDGDLDVAAVRVADVALLFNEGDASFASGPILEVGAGASAVGLGDLNSDGIDDICVTSRTSDTVSILLNQEGGGFRKPVSYPAGDFPHRLRLGDLDADGDLDLITADRDSQSLTLLHMAADGSVGSTVTLPLASPRPEQVLLEDLDGDGFQDLAIAHRDVLVTRKNVGGGRFAEAVPFHFTGRRRVNALEAADMDGDGDTDLVAGISGDFGVEVLFNDGEGRMQAVRALATTVAPGGLVLSDLDGDGDHDFVVSRPAVGFLINSEGERRRPIAFQLPVRYAVNAEPHFPVAGDLDTDGDLDLVIGIDRETVVVLLNQGDGSFLPPVLLSPGGPVIFVGLADVDGGGDVDILAGDVRGGNVFVHWGGGEEPFAAVSQFTVSGPVSHIIGGDLDGDGGDDIVVTSVDNADVTVLRGFAAGGFAGQQTFGVGSGPIASAVADLDADGDLDVAVANQGASSVSLAFNDGTGELSVVTSVPLPTSAEWISAGDFDGDGWNDLAFPSVEARKAVVLWNSGNGAFEETSILDAGQNPFSITTGDVDGDGRLDLLLADPRDHTVAILLNGGGRLFEVPVVWELGGGQGSRFAVAADFDGSGDLDLVSGNHDTRDISVLLNERHALEGEEFTESLCTIGDFYRYSTASGRSSPFTRSTKFTLPVRDDPELLPVLFQNVNRVPLHQEFLMAEFPERFGGLTAEDYDQLVGRRATRDYYVGALTRAPSNAGFVYLFTVVADTSLDFSEVLKMDEVARVYEGLRQVMALQPLLYFPDTELARREAEGWVNPPFPVSGEGISREVDYEAYTVSVGYGRVRLLTLQEFTEANRQGIYTFQDILVIEQAPRDIEGVVAGVITAEVQGPLSHVAIRTARRGTPNVFVAGALEAFAPYEDKLVRLEVFESEYFVQEVGVEEAEQFWAENRPELPQLPSIDGDHRGLDHLLEMDLAEAGGPLPESRYGGKATNMARLQSVLTGEFEQYREEGFGIPVAYYLDFMRTNTTLRDGQEVTYEEYLRDILGSSEVQSDSQKRFEELEGFRDLVRAQGAVDPGLVRALVERIEEVFGAGTRMVRFRSSSNIEDALEFNGAGLYESTSVCAADTVDGDTDDSSHCDPTRDNERTIERALKKVWASLWTFRAHEERSFFQIPPESAAMGILVTRAFLDETANGVAFTGNPQNASDRRYVITAQVGEESVVSPEPGTSVERDLLEVVDGEVVRVFRERSSSLLQPGQTVLSDDQLRELGRFMWAVDQSFPLDTEGFPRERVLLDFEFKVEPDGSLAVKQVRPFLIPDTTPQAPTFELEIPPGTTVCGVFSKERVGRGPRVEYETKSIVRLRGGIFELPGGGETLSMNLIEEVRFGSEEAPAEPRGDGLFRVVRIADAGNQTIYRFSYEQEFTLPGGETFAIHLPSLNFMGRGGVATLKRRDLDDEYLTEDLRMEGTLMGVPVVSYSSCTYELLPHWRVDVELEDGSRIVLEERFDPTEILFTTGPASLVRAEVELEGKTQVVMDYWRLVYAARRHNRNVRYWVVLEPALSLPGLDRAVRVVEVVAPEPFDNTREEVIYLDDNFEVLARPPLVSYAREEVVMPEEVPFRRGDVDGDGVANLMDPLRLANFLFSLGARPHCLKSSDVDDSGALNVLDAIVLLRYLFEKGPAPPVPFTGCGSDPTEDGLSCERFTPCAGR